MEEYFTVKSKLGKTIRTSLSYWHKIVTFKHPVMRGKQTVVKQTLADPDIVKESQRDESVCLYYRKFRNRYVCVVIRHENGTGFIISTYPVDKVKYGKTIYEKTQTVS